MICLKPVADPNKESLFRQDGIYLCLTGKTSHKLRAATDYHEHYDYTKPNSYNMFRVINEDTVIMLGSHWCNFYTDGKGEHVRPVIQIGYSKRDIRHNEYHYRDRIMPLPEPKDLWLSKDKNVSY